MKPRLLFIVGRFVIGGHATDNIPLLYHLKDKYTVKILYGEKEADELEPLFLLDQFPGIDIEKLPVLRRAVNPFVDLITLIRVYKSIRRFKPNIVHTHGAKAGFTGRLAARLWGKPVIIHTFHGHLFHSYFSSIITKSIIKLEKVLSTVTDAAIALSPSQKDEIVEKFKIFPARKVAIIPLGLFEPAEPSFYKKKLRSENHLANEDVAIGLIGRLVPIKNPVAFLEIALTIIEKGHRNVKFFVIGDGQERQKMVDFLVERNIPYSLPGQEVTNAQVIFTSWIANMYEVIYELDVVVLTSLNEGTPVSLIEAQLCSKPVVSYDVGGVKDTFLNNETGFLVNKGDISTFANQLIKLIKDKELRITMGEKGKAYSSKKFSKLTEVALVDELYTNLLKKKK